MVDKSVRKPPSDYRLTHKKKKKILQKHEKEGEAIRKLIREANN